ncbi:exostosin 3 [Fusarium mundagurra]|uniref:Exostosin 3 n=1 Tax=Fusarium mundagurra TaxID=1567541 RepID=A0A8H6D980_9HYPO|nr:exostosin 3 [Fusarium mundagurra]
MTDYNTKLPEYIDGWLNTFIADTSTPFRRQKRDASLSPILNWNDMPTPPPSDMTQETPRKSRRRSPKRPRQDATPEENTSQETPFDDNQTPTGPARTLRMAMPSRPFSNPPSLPPSSSTSQSSNRSRSTSPVKRSTLELLQKPVKFIPMHELKVEENIQKTFNRIFDISYGDEFIPNAVEKEIQASGQRAMSGWFFEHSDDKTTYYMKELAALLKIKDTARFMFTAEAVPILNYLLGLAGVLCFALFSLVYLVILWMYDFKRYKAGSMGQKTKYDLHVLIMILGFYMIIVGAYSVGCLTKEAFDTGAISKVFDCANNSGFIQDN